MIAQNIMRIKNNPLRRVLWVLYFPIEYVGLLHDRHFANDFNGWTKTVFLLGWRGV